MRVPEWDCEFGEEDPREDELYDLIGIWFTLLIAV
jgi:hypothetical protein